MASDGHVLTWKRIGIGAGIGALLFPCILVTTILQNYFDLRSIFSGDKLDLLVYSGSVVLKLLKDVVYLGIFVLVIREELAFKRPFANWTPIVFLLFLAFSFGISAIVNNLAVAAIGLRWIEPFILFLFLRHVGAKINPAKGIFWLLCGLVLCFFSQIYQLFFMPAVYGVILQNMMFGGLAARTPGIFAVPNTAAFFACSCCACIAIFASHKYWTCVITACLSLLICLLTQSGTGIITAIILLVWLVSGRYAWYTLFIAAVLSVLIFFNLDAITGRANYIAISGGTRLSILVDMLRMSVTSIDKFGVYTNAARLYKSSFATTAPPDSLWSSWFGNFGILAPVQLLVVAGLFIQIKGGINWRVAFPCVLVFFLFSMTTIVFEAYPMNLLLGIGFWAAQTTSFRRAKLTYSTRP